MHLLSILQYSYRLLNIILFLVDFAEIHKGIDIVIMLD